MSLTETSLLSEETRQKVKREKEGKELIREGERKRGKEERLEEGRDWKKLCKMD